MPSLHERIAAHAGCGLARGALKKRQLTVALSCAIKYDIEMPSG